MNLTHIIQPIFRLALVASLGVVSLTAASDLHVLRDLMVDNNIYIRDGYRFHLGTTHGDSTGASRALVKSHKGGVLNINYQGDFKGGVHVQSDLRVRGNLMIAEKGYMLKLGVMHGDYTGDSRALVKSHRGGTLLVNYRNDFRGGVRVMSDLRVDKLLRADSIVTGDLLVKANWWADHVFDEGYELMPLAEVKAFIAEHKHLPDMPSEREIVAGEGLEVDDMLARQQQKIEELTLHAIAQEERLQAEQRSKRELEQAVSRLQATVDRQQALLTAVLDQLDVED